jgi:hypothetical protein
MTISPTTIILVVSPALNTDGGKAYGTRGMLFDGSVDGRGIVKRTATPFVDAARNLRAEGADPDTVLVMRHDGSPHDALRATIRVAAKLTTADDGGGKPVFRNWKPYDAVSAVAVAPPIAETAREAAEALFKPGRVLDDLSQQVAEEALLREIEALGAVPELAG